MGLRFAVIGHPIQHSLSPAMHRAAFAALGLDHSYIALDIPQKKLKTFVEECKQKGTFRGFNVTIPHKVEILHFLDALSEEAKLLGAVNTVDVKHGRAVGYNTDGVGCVRALEERGIFPKASSFLILGAGGAGRAIALQLALEGAEVWLSNRTAEKAEEVAKLAEGVGKEVKVVKFEPTALKAKLREVDVLINATSVGMWPKVEEAPIPPRILRRGLVVMDIVYKPLVTKLLMEASKRGCKTIDGVGMLVHQGAEALRIWLGLKEVPVEVMREAVLNALKLAY